MEIKSKYPQALIDKAHDLAFRGELSNKAIAAKLGLEPNQLHYIIYKLEDSGDRIGAYITDCCYYCQGTGHRTIIVRKNKELDNVVSVDFNTQ